jgi:hypothetical protein
MKLDVRAAALAAGIVAALLYAICTALCAVLPDSAIASLGLPFLRIDLMTIYRPIGWMGFVIGLLEWGLGTAVTAGLAAWLYNRLARAGKGGKGT